MNVRRCGAWLAGWTVIIMSTSVAAATPEGDRLYQSALAKYNAKDYRGAVSDAEGATTADPSHWQAWQLDGNARYAIGDTAGAVTVYKYSLRINPDNPGLKTFVDSIAPPAGSSPPPVAGAASTTNGSQASARPEAAPTSPVVAPASSGPQPEPGGLRAEVFVGFHTVGLSKVIGTFRDAYQPAVDATIALGGTGSLVITPPAGLLEAGLEINRPLPGTPFTLGARVAYAPVVELTVSTARRLGVQSAQRDETLGMSTVAALAGGTWRAGAPGGVRIRVCAMAGYALLDLSWFVRDEFSSPTGPLIYRLSEGGGSFSGGGPMASAEIEAAYPVSHRLEVFLRAGYVYCVIPSAVAYEDVDFDGDGDVDAKAGEGLVDADDKPVPYDLGGLGGRGGLQLFF